MTATIPVVIQTAELVISVPKLALAPQEDWPEIALVGRSNVGKSSWINAMLGRKQLARTSNTPGKTRLLNFYKVQAKWVESDAVLPPLMWVDLPGYGYAKVSKAEQAQWRKHLEQYLLQRAPLRWVIQLIDMRHGLTDNDLQMAEWLAHHDIQPLLVLTKADKVGRNQWEAQRQQLSKAALVDSHFVVPFSAETRHGVATCWKRLLEQLDLTPPTPNTPG